MSISMYAGQCTNCHKSGVLVGPLHDHGGGPPFCIPCGIEWHANRTKQKRYAAVFRVMAQRLNDLGVRKCDLDLWQAIGTTNVLGPLLSDYADNINDNGDDKLMTLELLEDCIRLTHPDKHPEERKQKAGEVTRALVALKPYTLPKSQPKDEPKEKPRDTSVKATRVVLPKPLREYPCDICFREVPHYYCDKCKAEWNRRLEIEQEQRRVKQRKWYATRKRLQRYLRDERKDWPDCSVCGEKMKGKRKDAKFCSAACRQKAHRASRLNKNRTREPFDNRNRVAA